MAASESYQSDVTYIPLSVFNARIEAESVDPNAVSDSPVTDDVGIRIVNVSGATGNGQALGYIAPGSYAEYEINVPAAGTYDLYVSTAGIDNGATLNFGDGTTEDAFGSAGPFQNSGYQTYYVDSFEDALTFTSAGIQTVRITFVNSLDFDWFTIIPAQ